MILKEYTITAPEGIHARPATSLIRLVKKFKAETHIKKGEEFIKLNSVLNILSMSTKLGQLLTIKIEGEEEEQAAAALDHFFEEELKDL